MTNKDALKEEMKRILRAIVPKAVRELRGRIIRARASTKSAIRKANKEFNRRSDQQFANKSPREVFTTIYEKKLWGGVCLDDFYSGSGSHDELTVNTYVNAVRSYLENLPYKPDAVDLGCGDFNVGKQIRSAAGRYTACDVVSSLIERNKIVHRDLNVEFKSLDMCDGALPRGDVVFIRQVFQHLSNAQVLSVVRKLPQYKVLILTEGLPADPNFVPNEDKPIGDGVRFQREVSSGIVVTRAPFNLVTKSETVLCEVPAGEAVIRTIAYQLQ